MLSQKPDSKGLSNLFPAIYISHLDKYEQFFPRKSAVKTPKSITKTGDKINYAV